MANSIVLHPDGADTNGGGYDQATYVGDWSDWHTSFGPKVAVTGGSYDFSGSPTVVTKTGEFGAADALIGIYAYISGTNITAGRYLITDNDANTITLSDTIGTDDSSDVVVNVGGAILTPSAAALLAYDDQGSQLLLPANQTTQTINEVDGDANSVTLVTQGYTLDIKGVNDTTGELLEYDDLWPMIKAKSGSTWGTSAAMVYMQSGSGDDSVNTTAFGADKVIFDGNNLAQRVMQLGDHSNDYVGLYWGDIVIQNGYLSAGYNLYILGYLTETPYTYPRIKSQIHSLLISGGYTGVAGGRYFPSIINFLRVTGAAMYGIDCGAYSFYSLFYINNYGPIIIDNCAVGMRNARYDSIWELKATFVNNVIDIVLAKYGTTYYKKFIRHCLFYNDNASGAIIVCESGSDDYVDVWLDDCVLGTSNGAVVESGITCVQRNCKTISVDPFMDKANSDFRLNPNSSAFSTVYDSARDYYYGACPPAHSTGGSGGKKPASTGGGFQ